LTRVPRSEVDPPRFAYLLLTHKDPQHVEMLVRRIQELSPRSSCVVHHDAATASLPWDGRPPERVHLVEAGQVRWGDWSMVEATERLLRFATDRLEADWFVLLSGEHRPTVDLSRWEANTAATGADALLGAEPLPSRLRFGRADTEHNMLLARSRHRWRLFARPHRQALHRSIGLLAKFSAKTRPIVSVEYIHRREAWAVGLRRRRRSSHDWSFYRGSQWFALNRKAADAALGMDPSVAEWFKKSWIPDEAYLHTALRHVEGLVVAEQTTTYVRETPLVPYQGWMQLSPPDLPAVWASQLPFARKVDPGAHPDVVASIDRAVDLERAAEPGRNHARGAASRA
jgi:hypothetical protein